MDLGGGGGVILAPPVAAAVTRFRFPAPSTVIDLRRPVGAAAAPSSVSAAAPDAGPSAQATGQFQPYYLRPAYRFKPQVTT